MVSLKSLPTSLRGKRINVSGGMSSAEVLVPDLQVGGAAAEWRRCMCRA